MIKSIPSGIKDQIWFPRLQTNVFRMMLVTCVMDRRQNRETHQSMFTRVGRTKVAVVVSANSTAFLIAPVYKTKTVIAMFAHTSSNTSVYSTSANPRSAFMETIVTRYVTDATAATSATSNITFFVAFFVSTPATNSSSSCSSKSLDDPENFAIDVALTLSSFFDSFFFKSSGERSLPSSLRAPSPAAPARARAHRRARASSPTHTSVIDRSPRVRRSTHRAVVRRHPTRARGVGRAAASDTIPRARIAPRIVASRREDAPTTRSYDNRIAQSNERGRSVGRSVGRSALRVASACGRRCRR